MVRFGPTVRRIIALLVTGFEGITFAPIGRHIDPQKTIRRGKTEVPKKNDENNGTIFSIVVEPRRNIGMGFGWRSREERKRKRDCRNTRIREYENNTKTNTTAIHTTEINVQYNITLQYDIRTYKVIILIIECIVIYFWLCYSYFIILLILLLLPVYCNTIVNILGRIDHVITTASLFLCVLFVLFCLFFIF